MIVAEMQKKKVNSVYKDLMYVDRVNTAKVIRYWTSKPYQPELLRKGWHPPHPTFLVREKIYEQYGFFNSDFKISSDYEIMLRFLVKYKISTSYIPRVFVKTRVGGVSNRNIKNIIKANLECYKAWTINGLVINPLYIFETHI